MGIVLWGAVKEIIRARNLIKRASLAFKRIFIMNDTTLPRDEGEGLGGVATKPSIRRSHREPPPLPLPCSVTMGESVAQPGPQFPQMTTSESMNCKKMN